MNVFHRLDKAEKILAENQEVPKKLIFSKQQIIYHFSDSALFMSHIQFAAD